MIQQHVQIDTKLPAHYYILKFIVKLLFILWTTGVHMNILKLQQHLCGLHRTKSEFQVAYTK